MKREGVFIISLDFELHWGGFEKWPTETYSQYFANTRSVIPEMLYLFDKYSVHATWATVGMLFHDTHESLINYCPPLKPSYHDANLSAYNYIATQGIGKNEQTDPLHFAASLVNQIIRTRHQELASHTFSHYYCNEAGQTLDQFREDLKAAQRSAAIYDKKLKSLVFPRNQFNEDYLRVCFEEGFTSVRDNPRDWFWNIKSTQSESLWKRFNRGADAYFPIGKENTYSIDSLCRQEGLPVCIPASRLLRPYRPSELYLNEMKISRIKSEMQRAARLGEIYHLWWHPHNFGSYPRESIVGLIKILDAFMQCSDEYGMQSMSMSELTDFIA